MRWLSCFFLTRPLTGIMVLIYPGYSERFSRGIVSVPLRGLWFLSVFCNWRTKMISRSFRPLTGIVVLICRHSETDWKPCSQVSVPLQGLWFLSAPFINSFMKPLKWHFAGRIIYFHHFSSFTRKWFSKNRLGLNFKAAGRNRPACIFKKQVRHINNVRLTNSYYNTSS